MILKFFRRNIDTEPTPDSAQPTPDAAVSIADTREADTTEAHSAPCFKKLGPMWEERPKAPLAIVDGFHQEWLRSSITRHLPKHRVLHVRPDHDWHDIRSQLDRMDRFTLYSWQGGGRDELAAYARERGARAILVDYGPLPTVARSAHNRLAMSLRFDNLPGEPGASRHHRLLQILKRHDFDSDPDLLETGRQLLELYRGLGLSCTDRPGQPGAARHALGIKVKPRLLVIGQEDDYLATQNTSNRNIISRALRENPDHEILYWPHPAERKEATAAIEQTAALRGRFEVIRFNPVVAELFEQIDKVYVFDSDTGLDAVFYGLPVHALGRPYYAGWGLTDGRPITRNRTLGIPEMFSAVLVLYPSYLPEPDNPFHSLLATMLRHAAETTFRQALPTEPQKIVQYVETGGAKDYWPAILRREVLQHILTGRKAKSLPTLLPVRDILKASSSRRYQRFAAAFIFGQLKGTRFEKQFLKDILQNLNREDAKNLLNKLWKKQGNNKIIQAAIELHKYYQEHQEAESLMSSIVKNREFSVDDASAAENIDGTFLVSIARHCLEGRKLDTAENLFLEALLSGHVDERIIAQIAQATFLRQDMEGAARIYEANQKYSTRGRNAGSPDLLALTQALAGRPYTALTNVASAAVSREAMSNKSIEAISALENNSTITNSTQFENAILASIETLRTRLSPISFSLSCVRKGDPGRAIEILKSYQPKVSERSPYIQALSQALCFAGKANEARDLIDRMISESFDMRLINEVVRIGVIINDYDWIRRSVATAGYELDQLHELSRRKVLLGLRRIRDAYRTYQEISIIPLLRGYIGDKYVQSSKELLDSESKFALVVASYGPGDELRFASLYRKFIGRCPAEEMVFTCDPRLLSLMSRSLKGCRFVGVRRERSVVEALERGNFDNVPGADLHRYFDNTGWSVVEKAHRVTLVTDLIGDVIEDYSSFDGKPYLLPCPDRVDEFRRRLEGFRRGTTLLGLSWRSSLTTYSRDEHYLSVEQLAPLFEIEGIRFVNLQYDDCAAELAWIEERYPGKVINFEDLDQFDDLDGVAALMTATDAVIAPCTTVIELAGALGCRGYLLSNSSELHWRKKPGTKTDVWHNSLTHVEGASLGDKESLVEALVERVAADFSLSHRRAVI